MPVHGYQTTLKAAQPCETKPKVVLAIVNPKSGSGKGKKALRLLKAHLQDIELKVFETSYAGECLEICEKQDLTDVDVLCPIGGDGTVHEAVTGLMRRTDDIASKIMVAIVPAGSGNTVAYDLGIQSPEHTAELIAKAMFKTIDVARCQPLNDDLSPSTQLAPVYSINMIGWALPTQVQITADKTRKLGCGAMYDLAIFKYLVTNSYFSAKVTYETEDGTIEVKQGKMASFIVQNSVHLGSKTPFSPHAKLDDGLLDLTILYNSSVPTNIKTFKLAQKGAHVTRKQVFHVKVKSAILEPTGKRLRGPKTLNIDGELSGYSPLKISVLPDAIRVLTPE